MCAPGLVIDVVDVVHEAFDSAAREVEEQCVGVLKKHLSIAC